jgi:hypothetical protein
MELSKLREDILKLELEKLGATIEEKITPEGKTTPYPIP